jgi:hypothetical protein
MVIRQTEPFAIARLQNNVSSQRLQTNYCFKGNRIIREFLMQLLLKRAGCFTNNGKQTNDNEQCNNANGPSVERNDKGNTVTVSQRTTIICRYKATQPPREPIQFTLGVCSTI